MGLDFSKPAMTNVTATAGQTDKNEIAVPQWYRTQKMRSLLWNSMTLLPTGKK